MKFYFKKFAWIFGAVLSLWACRSDENNHDQEKPIIVSDYAESFPTSCTTLKRGEAFIFKAQFTDNVELGSYSLDIHHNFDKHNHDSSVATCANEDPQKKTPDNPFVFTYSEGIPSGRNNFVVSYKINIPNNIDTGDYHFMIKLTDKSGWATNKGISIKIVD